MLSKIAPLALAVVMLSSCGQSATTPTNVQSADTAPATTPTTQLTQQQITEKRVADLVALNTAIQAFHRQNGTYPPAPSGLTSILTVGNPNWIAGLAPQFIASEPRDPRMSTSANGPQYLYVSNGRSYKLIAHGVGEDCGPAIERDGIRRDPARTDAHGCWAYGFWTDDMSRF